MSTTRNETLSETPRHSWPFVTAELLIGLLVCAIANVVLIGGPNLIIATLGWLFICSIVIGIAVAVSFAMGRSFKKYRPIASSDLVHKALVVSAVMLALMLFFQWYGHFRDRTASSPQTVPLSSEQLPTPRSTEKTASGQAPTVKQEDRNTVNMAGNTHSTPQVSTEKTPSLLIEQKIAHAKEEIEKGGTNLAYNLDVLGLLYLDAKMFELATQTFERKAQIEPDSASTWQKLSIAYYMHAMQQVRPPLNYSAMH